MSSNKTFKQKIRDNENDQKKGFDPKTNTWTPHKSLEGGLETIAYGHKLKYKGEFTRLTQEEAVELFNKDYAVHEKGAARAYDNFTGTKGSFKGLESYKQEILTDISFNTGNPGQFKKLMTAMKNNNKEQMIEESKTFRKANGENILLDRRWEMRKETIIDNWKSNNQRNQNVNGVDLSYSLKKDGIIGFSHFNETMRLIYSKNPQNLLNIKLSYLAAALWVEYNKEVLDSNIRFSLDPIGSVHIKKFYPECIKDTDLGQVLFKSDFIMKMLSLDTKNNSIKSKMISNRLRNLGLRPAHEYDRNLGYNRHRYSRFWLNLKNANISIEEGAFNVHSVEIEVKAREMQKDISGNLIDKEIQDVNCSAFTFAANFTKLYDEIAKEFPVFNKLKQVCKAVVLAKHIKSNNIPVDITKILDCIDWKLDKPESVTEIMNKHTTVMGNQTSTLTISGGVDLSIFNLCDVFKYSSFPEEVNEIQVSNTKKISNSRIDTNDGPFIFQLLKKCTECKTIINSQLLRIYLNENTLEDRYFCSYHSDFTCKKCYNLLEGPCFVIENIRIHKSCFTCFFCGDQIDNRYIKDSNNFLHPECKTQSIPTFQEYDEMNEFLDENLIIQSYFLESFYESIHQRSNRK